MVLEDVAVPLECRIGADGDGFNIAMQDFDMSRPAVGALAVGIAQGALDIAAKYAQQRKTFGKYLMDHQAIQFMLADAAMNIEAGRGLVEKSSKAFDNGERNTMLASMAKCFCSDAAMKTTTDMVQILGGYGYTKEYMVEKMKRDVRITTIYEGTSQLQVLAAIKGVNTGMFLKRIKEYETMEVNPELEHLKKKLLKMTAAYEKITESVQKKEDDDI